MTGSCGLRRLTAVLAGAYLALTVALRTSGSTPPIPWPFLVLLAVVTPVAWAAAEATTWLAGVVDGGSLRGRSIAVAVGSLCVIAYRPASPLFVGTAVLAAAWMAVAIARRPAEHRAALRWALAALVFGYAAVWDGNYLALAAVGSRLQDAVLRALDLRVLGALAGQPVDYTGVFPLVHAKLALGWLENAYGMLFAEIAFLIMAGVNGGRSLTRLVGGLMACYAAGLLIFLLFPTSGPFLEYPESMSHSMRGTLTDAMMRQVRGDFLAVQHGGPPATGFGYFVGFPSLHVAVAVYCQVALAQHDARFWVLLPINLALIASTVLLGWHYVADVPGGIALGVAVVALVRPRVPRMGPAERYGQALCCIGHRGRWNRTSETLERLQCPLSGRPVSTSST